MDGGAPHYGLLAWPAMLVNEIEDMWVDGGTAGSTTSAMVGWLSRGKAAAHVKKKISAPG